MNKEVFLSAHERIRPYIHKTPVLESSAINKMLGAEIYFKCENLQRMGAFKMRGAMNAILNLTAEERTKGVVTHSSGNMAQAVALAAKTMNIPAYIVMPDNAPTVKKTAVLGYGGQVTECFPSIEVRQAEADKIIDEKGASFLHPSNDLNVIVGQGTSAMELINQTEGLELICTPVGGGGLLAGTALAAHLFSPRIKVIGGEPLAADDAYRSLAAGKIENNDTAETIADGLRTILGDINFPIIQEHVSEIIRVTEEEIISAMRLVWERMKIIIEPSSAVPLAAIIKEKSRFQNKRIGIIISGGNVDLSRLPF